MSIRTIVELHAHQGERTTLIGLMDEVASSMEGVPGFLGMTRYEVLDDPDRLIEIAQWDSPEARADWLADAVGSGALNRVMEALASPFRATSVREIDV